MINVYVISGFLGSGKTTFITKLLNEKKFEKVMLLENEFGEVGVDSAFFDKSLKIKEINNGCICCSLQGDFADALEEIEEMGVTDLIIEPSGVGKLSDIIDVIKKDHDFTIVSHICVVDVKTAAKYHKNFKEYFDDQVKAANAIILSHLDVASEEVINNTKAIIAEINNEAFVSNRPIDKYTIEDLLDIIVAGGTIMPEIEEDEHEHEHHHHHHDHDHECDDPNCECHHHHHHDDEDEDEEHHHHHDHKHHHHHDDEIFKSIALRPTKVYTKEEVEKILSYVDENVIRVKGYVNGEEGTLYFNYVLNEYHVYYGEKRDNSLVVIIGTEIDPKIEEAFHE